MTDPATTEATTSDAEAASTSPPPATVAELAERLSQEVERIDRELGEVDLLITQAKTEAGRHDARRAAAAEKLAQAHDDAAEAAALGEQLASVTKRAALMEAQVDVLEGKRRALGRHRDTVAGYAAWVAGMDPSLAVAGEGDGADGSAEAAAQPGVSRLVLGAQEDLRREIARSMHDGPAQSLTNIVLQAQIVERLVEKDPATAQGEVRQLVSMVQQTLEATKTFIFDVRPMVLDDLGLVPTLRRATRERGRRASVPVEFDSQGQDRRLPMDLESGLFRMLDEALVAWLERSPDRITMRLDWSPERVEATVDAVRENQAAPAPEPEAPDPADANLPPALAAMMEQRRADARAAAEKARRQSIVTLPPTTWREIQGRAATLGVTAELLEEGARLRLVAEAPSTVEG